MITIIISIRPEWAAKILNGEKTIEVRKGLALYNALKKAEERGEEVEFLMYVTKAKTKERLILANDIAAWGIDKPRVKLEETVVSLGDLEKLNKNLTHAIQTRFPEACGWTYSLHVLNGKVVARFKAKAERIKHRYHRTLDDWDGYYIFRGEKVDIREIELCELSCLNRDQLDAYLRTERGTALMIKDLEIFDKPKILADYGLEKAPQSWAYAKEGKE